MESEVERMALDEMIESALIQWQAEPTNERFVNGINDLISKAKAQGIGFRLEVFAEVLENHGLGCAITKSDANALGSIGEDVITFHVSPKTGFLLAQKPLDLPFLVFGTIKNGAVGFFQPKDINCLELE